MLHDMDIEGERLSDRFKFRDSRLLTTLNQLVEFYFESFHHFSTIDTSFILIIHILAEKLILVFRKVFLTFLGNLQKI